MFTRGHAIVLIVQFMKTRCAQWSTHAQCNVEVLNTWLFSHLSTNNLFHRALDASKSIMENWFQTDQASEGGKDWGTSWQFFQTNVLHSNSAGFVYCTDPRVSYLFGCSADVAFTLCTQTFYSECTFSSLMGSDSIWRTSKAFERLLFQWSYL